MVDEVRCSASDWMVINEIDAAPGSTGGSEDDCESSTSSSFCLVVSSFVSVFPRLRMFFSRTASQLTLPLLLHAHHSYLSVPF